MANGLRLESLTALGTITVVTHGRQIQKPDCGNEPGVLIFVFS